jgi:hypothetical protein
MHGRDRLQKFFEALRKTSLEQSMAAAFRTPLAGMEAAWLKKLRSYSPADATATAPEDAPVLKSAQVSPDPVAPGATVEVRVTIEDRAGDLLQGGVYLHEPTGGRVFAARPLTRNTVNAEFLFSIPIGAQAPPGRREFGVTAIDEAGNIRNWNGGYAVK